SDSLTLKYANTDKPHIRLTERVVAPEYLTGIDLITASHNHTDHLDAETLIPLLKSNPGARLLIPRANLAFVIARLGPIQSRLLQIDAGESVSIGGTIVHGIPAAHNTVERDDSGWCRCLGYVVCVGSMQIYHSGD